MPPLTMLMIIKIKLKLKLYLTFVINVDKINKLSERKGCFHSICFIMGIYRTRPINKVYIYVERPVFSQI